MKKPSQGRPFERRNGLEGFSWEGIATKVDPAGSPPNRPRDLVNVRLQGGSIISRPPFHGDGGFIPLLPIHDVEDPDATVNPPYAVADTERWTPHWLGDHGSAAGVRLWFLSEPVNPNDFAQLSFLDTDADQAIQHVAAVRLQATGFTLPIEKYNNEFYFGDYGGLRKLYLVPSREGAGGPPINPDQLADEVIVSFPGYRTGFLQENDGRLYFATVAGPSFGEVFAWDGLAVVSEFVMTASGAAGCIAAVYKDTLVLAMRDYAGAGAGALLVRDAAGAWSTVLLAGFNPTRFPCGIAEYGNLLYILDGTSKIFTWDGTTLALGHTLPVGAASLNACAKLAGRLYFAWVDTVGVIGELGFVDQDNVVGNRYTNHGTRTGVRAGVLMPTALAEYRGRLWITFTNTATAILMYHSQQFVPFDGWQAVTDAVAFAEDIENIPAPVSTMRTL